MLKCVYCWKMKNVIYALITASCRGQGVDSSRAFSITTAPRILPENSMRPVAYLWFIAPWDKVSFVAPAQPVNRSIDAKSELGAKGVQRWLGRAVACIYSFPYPSANFIWLWHHRSDVRTFESWKSLTIVEIRIQPRVSNSNCSVGQMRT